MKTRTLRAHSIFLEGSEVGVLLLHGITATPQCMKYLAETLHKAKFTVSVPLIKGHGTHYQHLEQTKWQDWYESAERAFQELKSQSSRVMVAGLSMGGLLAAHLAFHHPGTVSALALMATPIFLDGFIIKGLFPSIWKTPLKKIYRYQAKGVPAIRDPRARRLHENYNKIPIASVASLLELQKMVRNELKHIRQPTILLHSIHDGTVPYGNLDYIKAILPSDDIKAVTLRKSNHIITVDYEKDIVARQITRFFRKYRRAK